MDESKLDYWISKVGSLQKIFEGQCLIVRNTKSFSYSNMESPLILLAVDGSAVRGVIKSGINNYDYRVIMINQ